MKANHRQNARPAVATHPRSRLARNAAQLMFAGCSSLIFAACVAAPQPTSGAIQGPPTAEEATEFVADSEAVLEKLAVRAARAAWVQNNFITHDTEIMSAEAHEAFLSEGVARGVKAARYRDLELSADVTRKLNLLRTALTLPAPQDAEKTGELTRIATTLESAYGKGKYCDAVGKCWTLNDMYEVFATGRDADKLRELWQGWRRVSPPMRDDFTRLVTLSNEGAAELGFADTGSLWRSKYDMAPEAFSAELDRLWTQVQPLYEALHCHVRAKLNAHYGDDVVPAKGPLPAHLLGNMWGQEWGNIYDLVAPPQKGAEVDVTKLLEAKKVDAKELVRYGERFFTSLGFEALPETFWQRSLFVKPADRDVVCHASAWDVESPQDLRIKMCIQVNSEEFDTVHHELGHNFYQRAYGEQPFMYRGSANDGFHEAVGDTVALSVTPKYLAKIGLVSEVPKDTDDVALLMRRALGKIAFLPFGLLVDQWRWRVFSGEIAPDAYNKSWWALRLKYQGIAPPVPRAETDFDPGAKYHIPSNVPYTRYFLAHILQFQMQRALCEIAGDKGPLHRCSIYDNKEAGAHLNAMLEMGASQPWPDALEALTGQREMDATAVVDYFAPLKTWLDKENAARQCGW